MRMALFVMLIFVCSFWLFRRILSNAFVMSDVPANCSRCNFSSEHKKKKEFNVNKSLARFDTLFLSFSLYTACVEMQAIRCAKGKQDFMAILCRVHAKFFLSFFFVYIWHCGDNTIMNARDMIYGGNPI